MIFDCLQLQAFSKAVQPRYRDFYHKVNIYYIKYVFIRSPTYHILDVRISIVLQQQFDCSLMTMSTGFNQRSTLCLKIITYGKASTVEFILVTYIHDCFHLGLLRDVKANVLNVPQYLPDCMRPVGVCICFPI